MLVVHGLWRSGRLALWAEDSTLPTSPVSQEHPFAVRPELDGEPGSAELMLPTVAGRPADSPELVRDEEPVGGPVTLAAWTVPTVEFEADEALVMLCEVPPETVVAGASVRHLCRVSEFARDLVRRGRVLPWVDDDGQAAVGHRRCVWRPVLTGADADWARSLAMAQPPVARAFTPVEDTLNDLVDAAAKAVLGDDQAWLRALPADTAELQAALRAWQRDAHGSAVRACFRLIEPSEEDGTDWRIEFALQPTDEPSLVVPARRVWKGRSLPKRLAKPRETLLAELGRANRLWPQLEDALHTAQPSEMELDAGRAHSFLREAAPLLHTAGFGVLLPGWWGKPGSQLGVRIKAKQRTAPGTVATQSGLGSLVDFEWQLALGDEPLSEKELRELAKLKTPLVKVRGQWMELDAKRLAQGLKLLRSGGQMTVADLFHHALGTDDEDRLGLPVTSVTADGELGDLLSGAPLRLIEPPETFVGELRPYQLRGLSWLGFLETLGLGGVLADDMGLGKTVQLLALMAANPGRTLLVCPMSLVGNWEREAARFTPKLQVHVHHGAARDITQMGDADLVITTYSVASRDAALLSEIPWHRVVVDEAQAIKNAATRQATAIRSLKAANRVAVTGTPVENRLADLWSIMEFANPGLLGPAATFKRTYAVPIERHADDAAAERLKRITGPFVLRRLKTDKTIITDLPEKLEMEVLCNLTAEQASLYQAVVDDMMDKISSSTGIERRGLVLATMTKLKQVCNHPAQLLHDGSRLSGRSGKLARLEEIMEEILAAGEKALLFTQYASFGAMLRSHLSAHFGREVMFLHGTVKAEERSAMVRRFQSANDPISMFVLSLKAGGTGLTLTAANHVIHVDRWWNPAVEDQATDRAFRIGQKRNVQVRKFVCAGTVEEKIAGMIRDKRGLAGRIVGTGEQWIAEMSNADLRDLFALEHGAVSQ
ncbi:DEAD/DEAH box helicase [Allorhizocola rhizosphaerae]|uniref:DEAD/DEAH box helicase n=1 Tax=Allorhizocola rhizosphaerae TaxID=1872709 RepID=UPI000E3C15AB|nr:DEAD/DEAH box helicase [Allorhizocola rhizosphaerae]